MRKLSVRCSFMMFAACLLAVGCSKRPKDIISEDRMVEIMSDLQIAEAYDRSGEAGADMRWQNREMLGRGVLLKYGVSLEEMDSTLAWYGRNMDEYAKLYKKVDENLAKRQLKYARAAGESENSGPSADLWPYGRHFVVDDRSLADGIIADIPIPDLAPGDKIVWKMRTQGASARHITLGVDYEDGSSELVRTTNSSFDRWAETVLHTDTVLKVERIYASVGFDHSAPRVFVDSVMLLHQPFNREEYFRKGYQRRIGVAGRKVILPPDTAENSSLTPDSISLIPSSSTENSLGVRTRR